MVLAFRISGFGFRISPARPAGFSRCQQLRPSERGFEHPQKSVFLADDGLRRGELLLQRQPGSWISEANNALTTHQFEKVELDAFKVNHRVIVHQNRRIATAG